MTWNSNALLYLRTREAFSVSWLAWFQPLDRDTGARTTFGMSTHYDDENFTVNATSRFYHGLSNNFEAPLITYEVGTTLKSHELRLHGATTETQQLLRVFDLHLAPCELHCALFDKNDNLLDISERFIGYVDEAQIPTPKKGEQTVATITLISSAHRGVRTLNLKKSHESQKLRSGDTFRKYGSLGRAPADPWEFDT